MTILRRKPMEQLGFKGSGMFCDQSSYTHYYKVVPETNTVVIVGTLTPDTIGRYKLTKRDFTAFQKGKLSLIPFGCCNATGGRCREDIEILFKGDFKSLREFRKILAKTLP